MKRQKSQHIAIIAIFFAIMLLIHFISNLVFNLWPVPIKPTLIHIPVIIASILYGPRIGASLGALMGLISLLTNTIVILPSSYLFSPFVPNGNLFSLLIAFLPRILTGIFPYYIAKYWRGKIGLGVAGAIGSLTNTIFVLLGIFLFFGSFYGNSFKTVLSLIISTNSLSELIISVVLVLSIVPILKRQR
ncbi:ECF transporter S component [Streptococcus sp. zg-JUN1979]|uniref:ECF transporter S component n=1 Tax=Streptococcus sp. zg-JUN1979 TaxID=3391450 RepID=UPI0039A4C682